MTPWWIVMLFIVIGGFGFAGYRYGADSTQITCQKHDEAQQQLTIAAENNVIAAIGKQQTITQEVENAHHTGISVIDNLYATARVQPNVIATGHGMPPLPASAIRSDGTACKPSRTKYYRLNAQECDDNTAQLIDLQDWVKAQAAAH